MNSSRVFSACLYGEHCGFHSPHVCPFITRESPSLLTSRSDFPKVSYLHGGVSQPCTEATNQSVRRVVTIQVNAYIFYMYIYIFVWPWLYTCVFLILCGAPTTSFRKSTHFTWVVCHVAVVRRVYEKRKEWIKIKNGQSRLSWGVNIHTRTRTRTRAHTHIHRESTFVGQTT